MLAPQLDAFLGAVNDPESRERYLELKQAVGRLEVPTELTERLGAVAEVGLTRGRVRSTFCVEASRCTSMPPHPPLDVVPRAALPHSADIFKCLCPGHLQCL